MGFNALANKANPDQEALVMPDQGLLCLLNGNMIYLIRTLADKTSNFFVLCTIIYIFIHSGRSLA